MTTELFHAQLEENIVRAADERKRHQAELQAISRNYESELDVLNAWRMKQGKATAVPVMLSKRPKMNIRKNSVIVESFEMRQDSAETRRRLRRPTFGLSTTIPSRVIAITSLRDTEMRGGTYGSRRRTPAPRLDQRQERRSER